VETGTQQSSILMLTREHDDDASPQPAGILPSTNATDPRCRLSGCPGVDPLSRSPLSGQFDYLVDSGLNRDGDKEQ
jgi:hypothetical protein